MSIPLVQEATKDAINTSIIAIKRNIERINMLLGLVDSGSPDLSELATKQELEDAITQVETDLAPVDEVTSGNMQSVTSNAVYSALKERDDVYTLVGKKELTTTDVTSTLILSRKFSDYKLIIVNLYAGTNGNTIVGGHSIPKDYFTTQPVQIGFVSSDSVENAVFINTVSDTQVNLSVRFSNTSYKYVEILGIK